MTDIEHELENARHYLTLSEQSEQRTADAERRHAWDDAFAARRSFLRDFSAFLNAARTARNYLFRDAEGAGKKAWMKMQLDPPTFKFHADLAGAVFHEGLIAHTRVVTIPTIMCAAELDEESGQLVAKSTSTSIYVHHHDDGTMTIVPPAEGDTRFVYKVDELGPKLEKELHEVTLVLLPIIDLAKQFADGLEGVHQKARGEGIC